MCDGFFKAAQEYLKDIVVEKRKPIAFMSNFIIRYQDKEDVIDKAMERVKEIGYIVCPMVNHIHKDDERCWSCGACVSVCPTKSITVDEDYKVVVNYDSCIACGSCVDACAVKALRLTI